MAALPPSVSHSERALLNAVGFGPERAALMWLARQAEPYPRDKLVPPLRSPKRRDHARLIGVLDVEVEDGAHREPAIRALHLATTKADLHVVVDELQEGRDEGFERLLLSSLAKSRLLFTWGWSAGLAHLFLRTFARSLLPLGYTIDPLATGADIRGVVLRKGRRAWWLCDVQQATGTPQLNREQFVAALAPRFAGDSSSPQALAAALEAYQRMTLGLFRTALRPTMGAAAVHAASQHVPASRWLWRPSPMLAAWCRAGGAFRGGYSVAHRYVGPAWSSDLNSAYTAALAIQLPARSALSTAPMHGELPRGIWLCELRGPGTFPAYISRFVGWERGFERQYWNGAECLTLLPTAELAGLRALGYVARPLVGYQHVAQWTLAPFAAQLAAVRAKHGRGSLHERTARLYANAVYGKFAESPRRQQVRYALERPGPEWHPYIGPDGWETTDVWQRTEVSYRGHQHIDVAATITAHVRGQLYTAIAAVARNRGRVVHADTDGLLTDVDPRALLDVGDAIGRWRVSDAPAETVVWGKKGSMWGSEVRTAGLHGLSADEMHAIARGEVVETQVTQRGAPWTGAPLSYSVARTVRATA